MYKVRSGLFVVLAAAIALTGCSGGSNQVAPPPPGSAAVSFTVTDTPPTGAGILSFEATMTGAALNPGNVDLLGGTTPRIEVKQLETESAFLNTKSVTAGTYTSINLTFSMPEVTFVNNTAAMLAGCAVGAVCENQNLTGTLTSTFTFPGSGITISANSPTGLRVDISPDVILTPTMGVDFSAVGATTVTQLTAQPAGELDDLDDIRGTVQNLDTTNKKFDLVTFAGTFSITTNANTQFEFEGCLANPNDFTCLANGKVVEVDAMVQPGGTFVAKKIEFEDDVVDDEIEGVVSKVDDATHFELVVLEELRNVTNVDLGNPVKVTIDPLNIQFKVKDEGLTVPSGLKNAFEAAVDTLQLIPGQAVEVRLKGAATAGTPVLVTADRVRLRMSRFTAKIKAGSIVSPDFSVDNLPPVFTPATTVHVQTQPATKFEGKATTFADLADGNTVSLKGLLFANGPNPPNPPELIAKKVRKR